jgi:hypothetical protein
LNIPSRRSRTAPPDPGAPTPRSCASNPQRAARRAFVAYEAAAICVVALVAISITLTLGAKSRATTGLNRDLGNLRQIGQWTHAYAADFEDRAPALDEAPDSKWPVLRPVPGSGQEVANAAKHAVDIIRRRTGRVQFPSFGGWIANILYSHLVVADYADLSLLDRRFVAAGDAHRMNWTDDPENKHDFNFWQPFQQPQGGVPGDPVGDPDLKWPYSASFQLAPAWYDEGQTKWEGYLDRIYQSTSYSYFTNGDILLRAQRLSTAAFPSGKVIWHDYGDWYHAREPRYFAAPAESGGARASVLLADSSARVPKAVDANPGWDPPRPDDPDPTRFLYDPRSWEPSTTNGLRAEVIPTARYRWTRGGLKGRDFDGTEINTGQR